MKSNLNSAINKIDNEIIEYGVNVQTKEQMREVRKVKKNKRIIFGSTAIGLAAVAVALVILIQPQTTSNVGRKFATSAGLNSSNNYATQIANPIYTLDDDETFDEYVDYDVPILDKEIESRNFIAGDTNEIVEVNYEDGTKFRMSKDSTEDISGVYGATQNRVESIDGVSVELYEYDSLQYASWIDDSYSYVYYASDEIDINEVEEIISKTK